MSISRIASDWSSGLTPDADVSWPIKNGCEDSLSGVLIGRSLAIRRVRARVLQLARTNLSVLIEGPTGAGKELVAQLLHDLSGRRGRLVPFNVSAIGESMFEDALFGHVRGAFTGASGDVPGFLLEADGGTLFLDEISTLPLPLQGKLLRAVETRDFRPVGAREDRHSEFRLIAATNDDLGALALAGKFREDLLYRIRAGVVRVPSLRERVEDIVVLAAQFTRVVVADRTPVAAERVVPAFSDTAMQLLQAHHWRGNVRELRHVVELALVLGEFRPVIGVAEVQEALRDVGGDSSKGGQREIDRDVERRRLVEALDRCDGEADVAARSVGISKSHMYRRMRELGIPPRQRRPSRDATEAAEPSVPND
jgi:DNA-binding NtrC family response regulator